MKAAGDDVEIVTPDDKDEAPENDENGYPITTITGFRFPLYDQLFLSFFDFPRINVMWARCVNIFSWGKYKLKCVVVVVVVVARRERAGCDGARWRARPRSRHQHRDETTRAVAAADARRGGDWRGREGGDATRERAFSRSVVQRAYEMSARGVERGVEMCASPRRVASLRARRRRATVVAVISDRAVVSRDRSIVGRRPSARPPVRRRYKVGGTRRRPIGARLGLRKRKMAEQQALEPRAGWRWDLFRGECFDAINTDPPADIMHCSTPGFMFKVKKSFALPIFHSCPT